MGRFFAKQNLDEAGIVGVTLQKLLIFFMIIDAVSFFFGISFFSSFMSLLFHFVVFMGVYRRRTCVLLLYVIFHVAIFILAAFAVIFVVSSLMYASPNMDTNNDYIVDYNKNATTTTRYDLKAFTSMFTSEQRPHNYSTANTTVYPAPATPSGDVSYDESVFFVSIVLLLLSVILLYCKILSVVLAHRMRKLLLAPTVSNPVDPEKQQTGDSEPTYIPADFENRVPIFTQPGFAYQPMMPGQSSMMPAPFMYGQHPVFYSYGPGPVPTNDNEKL